MRIIQLTIKDTTDPFLSVYRAGTGGDAPIGTNGLQILLPVLSDSAQVVKGFVAEAAAQPELVEMNLSGIQIAVSQLKKGECPHRLLKPGLVGQYAVEQLARLVVSSSGQQQLGILQAHFLLAVILGELLGERQTLVNAAGNKQRTTQKQLSIQPIGL